MRTRRKNRLVSPNAANSPVSVSQRSSASGYTVPCARDPPVTSPRQAGLPTLARIGPAVPAHGEDLPGRTAANGKRRCVNIASSNAGLAKASPSHR
jgi:hypothetical protein